MATSGSGVRRGYEGAWKRKDNDTDKHINTYCMTKTLVSFGAGRSTIVPADVRSAYRDGIAPANRYDNYGFRPSRTYH